MRKCLVFLAGLLVATLTSSHLSAQAIVIRGTVRNAATTEIVPAVSVTVKGTSQGTYTDDKGNFTITTTAKLPLTLVFSSVGYDDKEVVVDNANMEVKVDMTPRSTLGQEVVIAATRTSERILESPVTIERMGASLLRSSPAPYYEAINNLKGVDMHTASLTFRTVTTRGFVSSGNTRANQLIDGMDNQAPGLNFSVGNIIGLTELDVDNIELLSGASSALYGSGGMNGTILITSKNPFKYQGLSFNVKQGIMHVDGKQRDPSPYYDWSLRWAKAIKNKLAFKFTGQLLKANDWQADDYRNVSRTSVISKLIGGNRLSDPNYDGINVYGDETSANIRDVTGLIQENFRAGIANATGGLIPNIVNTLNAIIPPNATQAQINAILSGAFGANPTLLATVNQLFPFYWGLRNNWVPDQNVSRTGYEEKYLVDYNTLNVKFTGGLHYKITPNIEASWNSYWGTGTTVYTGADRYSLRGFIMAQHKLEIRHNNWFLRAYTTQENAGEAYNATVLGRLMQEAFKPSATAWYPQYIGNFIGYKMTVYGSGTTPSDYNAHQFARSAADQGRPLPGTPAFEALKKQIRTAPIPKGAKFLDRSDLFAYDGQLNFSDAFEFSDLVEVIAGAGLKQYVLNSRGTIFSDTAGKLKINEFGAYVQLKKDISRLLTLTGAVRYDKHENFEGRFTPRFTAVIHATQDHNVRLSYQTAYRFPSNQDQYINLNVGSGILIGGLPEFQTYYNLDTNPGYTAESVVAYRESGNPANVNLLVPAVFEEMKPESVSSYELGYKGLFMKRLLVDAYVYYSVYQDFLARVAVGQSMTGSPTGVYNPFTTRNLSYQQTSESEVKALGWGVGVEYQLPRNFIFTGNMFSDKLQDLDPGLISFFNAPELRWNLGLRNDNVYKNFGFSVLVKWQDNNYYEGTFATGTLPYFTWVDAQVSYKMPKTKSIVRLGGTNIGNNYYRTGFGSPYVGGVYYVSYGYNLF